MKKTRKIACKALMGLLFFALFTPSLSRAEAVDSYRGRVARAASRLEPVTGLSPKIIIKEDDAQSAFVLPDGTVVISRGLLASTGSDDEVAFVIAHEISHIIARDQMGPAAKLTGLSDRILHEKGRVQPRGLHRHAQKAFNKRRKPLFKDHRHLESPGPLILFLPTPGRTDYTTFLKAKIEVCRHERARLHKTRKLY
ncbi:MAG: M48 family metalloprotease [Deltaproteobacteria bacterium]|nr:M48 family metalloprotease [Deltaproteobacteria bacterium]